MPSIPFFRQQSGAEELAGGAPRMINAVVESSSEGRVLSVRSRPGIKALEGFPSTPSIASPIIGIGVFEESVAAYVSEHVDLVLVSNDRKLWHLELEGIEDDADKLLAASDSTAASKLAGTSRPVFAASKTHVVVSGGNTPQLWLDGSVSRRLAGSPPWSTHACYLANRIVTNNLGGGTRERINWSGAGETNHETWYGLNYNEADARADHIKALYENTNELFAFGTETLQIAQPDPVVGFSFGRAVNIGCGAAYSPVRVDDQFAWLSNHKRFVLSDGRGYQNISKDIDGTLREFYTHDAWGWKSDQGRVDIVGWNFPTANRTFVWHRDSGLWCEFRSRTSEGLIGNFLPTAITYVPQLAKTVVGLSTGVMAEMNLDTYTDLGTSFPIELVTGFVNWDTEDQKLCRYVRFTFKRGRTSSGSTDAKVLISWKDDLGAFGSPTEFDLGNTGDDVFTVELRSAGAYRRRQWRLQYESSAELVFCGAEETFDKLSN